MTGKEVIKRLKRDGWIEDRIVGSHHICEKDGKTIVVPVHGNKDLDKGMLHIIKKQAGW